MRIKGVTEILERRLFHGTDDANVDTICKYNFDVRLAGKNGHLYGKGNYNYSVMVNTCMSINRKDVCILYK